MAILNHNREPSHVPILSFATQVLWVHIFLATVEWANGIETSVGATSKTHFMLRFEGGLKHGDKNEVIFLLEERNKISIYSAIKRNVRSTFQHFLLFLV